MNFLNSRMSQIHPQQHETSLAVPALSPTHTSHHKPAENVTFGELIS